METYKFYGNYVLCMKSSIPAVLIAFLICVAAVMALVIGFSGVVHINEPLKPSAYKNITVDAKYERTDAYLNHYPPYVTTSEGDIFDITNDMAWAKLKVGKTYYCGYISESVVGRARSGTLVYIDFESEV